MAGGTFWKGDLTHDSTISLWVPGAVMNMARLPKYESHGGKLHAGNPHDGKPHGGKPYGGKPNGTFPFWTTWSETTW